MPTRPSFVVCLLVASALVLTATAGLAQTPPQEPAEPTEPPPPPGWTGSIGAGWAATSGNSDTSTVNLAHELVHDSGGDFVFKSTGLYLRGDSEGDTTVERASVDARMDYRLSPRLTTFALTAYARDRFKDINYLVSETAGFSFRLVPEGKVEWTTDASVGLVVEQNRGFPSDADGAILFGERFVYRINDDTRIINAATGLWKMDDFGDAVLYVRAGRGDLTGRPPGAQDRVPRHLQTGAQ